MAPAWLGSEAPYDFIFCRNLLIYLTEAARRRVLDTLMGVLAPDGWIVVGHAEALDSLDARFVAVGERGAFSYALRVSPREPVTSPTPLAAAAKAPKPASPAAVTSRARGKAAARRAAVSPSVSPAPSAAIPAQTPPALERAAELRRSRGELAAAAALCEERLRGTGDDAEAHQLLGVIRQAQGDASAAELCYSRALYCDPGLAPAMLQLALLLERRGERDGAALLRRRAERRKETI